MSMAGAPASPAPVARDYDELTADLARLLVRALRLLGTAGATDPACHLAAQAWRVTHHANHPAARRFGGLLHDLTRHHDNEGDVMTDAAVLDVREEIPARRHELIFDTYGALAPGEAFVLVNDHDPKPLYYQFAAEHPNQFEWDYVESGPQVWKVRIGRPTA